MSTVTTFQIGTSLEIEATIYDQADAILNVKDASTIEILIQLPNGITMVKTATLSTDGTDGMIKYVCTPTDIPIEGTYKVQGRAEFPDNLIYKGDIHEILGIKNL